MSRIKDYENMGWRILWYAGQVPIFPNSNYKSEWTDPLMIYKGQFAINIIDEKAWYCSETQIVELISGGLTTTKKFIEVTGSTYTLNETGNYSEIIILVQSDCTLTLDTEQLDNQSLISIKVDGDYDVIVETEGSEKIDNEDTQELYQYDNMQLFTDGSNWYIK